jgi:hypothetical protein
MIHVWRLFIGLWLYVLDPVFRKHVQSKRGGNERVRTGEGVTAIIYSNGNVRRIK